MDDLVRALRAGEQADMDGILVKVSRQACEEAADAIEALQARVAKKDAEIERLRHDRDNWRGRAEFAEAQFDALAEMAPPPQKGLLLRRLKEIAAKRGSDNG